MPLFVLHSMSGNLFEWHDLIARLNAGRPLVGIETRALDSGHVPATSIEVLAADYVELIREHQPEGPYSLMGYSLGGLLAHEVAVRLERAGKQVAFVGLIDTYVSSRALTWPERLQFVIERSIAIGRRIVELGAMRALDQLAAKALVASKFSRVLAGNGAAATGQGLPDRGATRCGNPWPLASTSCLPCCGESRRPSKRHTDATGRHRTAVNSCSFGHGNAARTTATHSGYGGAGLHRCSWWTYLATTAR